ncbi:MAG: methylenetetrahydromethanopterin dehydrogenase [Gammaproteobacteria bacterium]|jgi:methylene-tetrahydromethanopterin dehydrogenase|nr:methylenetetrahydromethanopterin dehydrogenase [Gammaproteobacteria bacterium]MBT4462708.1 methylenetetrahydromethanopterin dehydrogenase [Gammaproteobacteria bacterium]MBT4654416.1 methylenetetrahydromethanopterin dehydrogenase [Gammaproteobacteria bacterium]MBT5117182.1 methylenetetrahydromethanopterin dehydrogenase [Gammaproteobacteria bacterium]MBT5761835.1 methylenetetrahydromethanopterin dehydrogenase [Gammaproteobacteria bacterium]
MEKPFLLHMITPEKNISPFDANMAFDAGWNSIIPYTNIEMNEIQGIVQDTIFSRSPSALKRTGIFIGGRDPHTAMDMIEEAKKHMVPPFEVPVFADPSGAFTTAAGMVAITEKALKDKFSENFTDKKVVILGGTGPVGVASAVISAKAGNTVLLVGRSLEKAESIAKICNEKYGSKSVSGAVDAEKASFLADADVVFNTGAAGIQLMNDELIKNAVNLKICADVNAVPPAGISGIDAMDNVVAMKNSKSGCFGIGALAIGNIKYKSQHDCLKLMYNCDKPVYLHFEHAFEFAQKNV